MNDIFDLGGGVTGHWLGWAPDRSIPSNAERYAGVADIPKCCLELGHANAKDGTPCVGIVTIDQPGARQVFPEPYPLWRVESWEPLTISPSVLCSCGWHGFVRKGRWVPA